MTTDYSVDYDIGEEVELTKVGDNGNTLDWKKAKIIEFVGENEVLLEYEPNYITEDADWEVTQATHALDKAQNLPNGMPDSDWSRERDLPQHFVFTFPEAVTLTQCFLTNVYSDNDTVQQLRICAPHPEKEVTKTYASNPSIMKDDAYWDKENSWQFTSAQSTELQAFNAGGLPMSNIWRFSVETTYSGYTCIKNMKFNVGFSRETCSIKIHGGLENMTFNTDSKYTLLESFNEVEILEGTVISAVNGTSLGEVESEKEKLKLLDEANVPMNLTIKKDGVHEAKQITIYYYPLGRVLKNVDSGLEIGEVDEATCITGKSVASINGKKILDSADTSKVTSLFEEILSETDKLDLQMIAPPPKTIKAVHKTSLISKLDRSIPRTNATVMKRGVGKCKKLGIDNYTCEWCNRRKIDMIDPYYHVCVETKSLLCYQCYNDKTSYAPLYHDTKVLPTENHFKDLWKLNDSTPIPALFQLLKHEFSKNTEQPMIGHAESLLGGNPPEMDESFVSDLTQFAETLLHNVLQEWNTLKQTEHESVFRWAILNENYEHFQDTAPKVLLDKHFNLIGFLSKVEDRKPTKELLQILSDIQSFMLQKMTEANDPVELSRIPKAPKQEVEIIKNLELATKVLSKITKENPINKSDCFFLQQLAEDAIDSLDGEDWINFLLLVMDGNSVIESLINLPPEMYQILIPYIFEKHSVIVEEPAAAGAPPSMGNTTASPTTLKRMASYTAIRKIDLKSEDVGKLSQEQVEIMGAAAESVDLFTLLELLRKDVHGFGLKGAEASTNGLAKLLNSYHAMSDAEKPPETLFENTASILCDKMIDLQFWDELDYVKKNCQIPKYLEPKFELYLIVFHLSSSVQNVDLTRKMLDASNFGSISEVKSLITDISSSNHTAELRKILKLDAQDRQQVLGYFEDDEIDYDVICPLCYNLPMTHTFDCGHKVCEPCYQQLMATSKRCPFDRKAIS